jgi:hypothetical protein
MGKGNWTSSGHFIVVWWQDGKVRINDSASTKDARVNGDITTFRSQVKYYWAIDARAYNGATTKTEKEEDDMTYYEKLADVPSYYKDAIQKLVNDGTLKGDGNGKINVSEDLCRIMTILNRKGLL